MFSCLHFLVNKQHDATVHVAAQLVLQAKREHIVTGVEAHAEHLLSELWARQPPEVFRALYMQYILSFKSS